MKFIEYIYQAFIREKVTDIFGIPGGVLLGFLSTFVNKSEINIHLNYHEQAAGFCACGYSQVNGSLGVAYATKGPGFTNLITPMADAYCDSLSVLFITSHTQKREKGNLRFDTEQELDCIKIVESITKFSAKIDDIHDCVNVFEKAIELATSGRKGPVLLDINSHLFNLEVEDCFKRNNVDKQLNIDYSKVVRLLTQSKKPIILAGDGIHQSRNECQFIEFVKKLNIPVLSSRSSQDLLPCNPLYFGYIGSHGLRYSNSILYDADLILCIGNRLAFPFDSLSYGEIIAHAKFIRVDVDFYELERKIPNSLDIQADLGLFIKGFPNCHLNFSTWIDQCCRKKKLLFYKDITNPVKCLLKVLPYLPKDSIFVSDVGNNEFWLSKALNINVSSQRTIFSKSFGALGCSIPKSIGAYYGSKKQIICFLGDQGIQINIQELIYIGAHHLPILLILFNDKQSSMIKDRELKNGMKTLLQVDQNSDYFTPNFQKICEANDIHYYCFGNNDEFNNSAVDLSSLPLLIEINDTEFHTLVPYLEKGKHCYDMSPRLDSLELNMLKGRDKND